MIPQDTVNLILDTARIEDVVSDFVTLKRRGASYVACCPFHNEKTPSFHVSPVKGIYKCFGCGKAGNAVGFVMDHERFSYVEALRYLASKYHIEIVEKEESAEEIAARQRTESLMLVSEFAQKFFSSNLDTPEGKSLARAYCRTRGMEESTVAEFGIGWAPSGRTAFYDAAKKEGYKDEYLLDSGLCLKYDDGRIVDRFHDRLMFPIHSLSGRVVAFSGRTLRSDGTVAKYVNSPETSIYIKGKSLFGIALAKSEISRLDKCYLAEGNVDVVSMNQAGFKNVIASCGTALTVEQIRIIRRFTENITVMYDGDEAGIHAALRAIGMLLKEGLNVKVLLFPDGDDPDSFCRKHSYEQVKDFIAENEQDFLDYMADRTPQSDKHDPVKRAAMINDIADTIAQIPDAVKRTVYLDMASSKFGVDSSILFERIRTRRNAMLSDEALQMQRSQRREAASLPAEEQDIPYYSTPTPSGPVEEKPIVGKAEQDLLYFLLTHGTDTLDFDVDSDFYSSENDKPTVADFIRASVEADGDGLYNSAYRLVYEAYMNHYDEGKTQDEIVNALLSSEDRTLAGISAQLSIEKYQLTVKNFVEALTTTSSWLTSYVPKALLYYTERKIEDKLVRLRDSLKDSSSLGDQTEVLTMIVKLQNAQRVAKIKLGREKNNI